MHRGRRTVPSDVDRLAYVCDAMIELYLLRGLIVTLITAIALLIFAAFFFGTSMTNSGARLAALFLKIAGGAAGLLAIAILVDAVH